MRLYQRSWRRAVWFNALVCGQAHASERKSWADKLQLAQAMTAALEPSEAVQLHAAHQQELAKRTAALEGEMQRRVAAERRVERLSKKLQEQRVSCVRSEVELMVQREVAIRQQGTLLPVDVVVSDRGRLGIRFRENTEQVRGTKLISTCPDTARYGSRLS